MTPLCPDCRQPMTVCSEPLCNYGTCFACHLDVNLTTEKTVRW